MSRSPSPMNTPSPVYSETSESEATEEEEEKGEEDTATCLWGECGRVFTHLPSLIEHIHVDHVGVNKSNYFCDWATCNRRGIPQTSRFALTSHLRSHTKEKPFVCPLPECDKSFTRSDALAKHLRHQHKQSPPAPGRGGSRKCKRNPDDIEVAPSVSTRSQTPTLSTFSLFDLPALSEVGGEDDEGYKSSGSSSDVIPPHLRVHLEPGTGRILGRSQEQVLYLLMKAKMRYAQEQNEALQEELRVVRVEMRREREEKERVVDCVLRGLFGGKADEFLVVAEAAGGVGGS
ncbi:hypothetical protein EDD18DRAFT_1188514 [Armillaria luteobubalina]|uniref:C2H2-type domain-containing protein n=1 Tax=Armillaria luteobubalina TaxID=153913 RepID=A0AA39URK6_9AGAR|nr:hypothetical protein EDD18DRAFT_1188514 [Armillaria luteobubalina]